MGDMFQTMAMEVNCGIFFAEDSAWRWQKTRVPTNTPSSPTTIGGVKFSGILSFLLSFFFLQPTFKFVSLNTPRVPSNCGRDREGELLNLTKIFHIHEFSREDHTRVQSCEKKRQSTPPQTGCGTLQNSLCQGLSNIKTRLQTPRSNRFNCRMRCYLINILRSFPPCKAPLCCTVTAIQ